MTTWTESDLLAKLAQRGGLKTVRVHDGVMAVAVVVNALLLLVLAVAS